MRTKMGGQFRLAPIMSDRLQAVGDWSTSANTGTLTWTDSDGNITVATANHIDLGRNDVPPGGNFLFEDGHVAWFRFDINDARDTVDVGSTYGGWACFYKLPNIVTN
jgi:hypothetical protein